MGGLQRKLMKVRDVQRGVEVEEIKAHVEYTVQVKVKAVHA